MSSTVESTAYELSKLGINGDFATSAPNLHKNIHLLSPEQVLYSICCRTICGSFGVDCDLNLLWPWQIVLAKMLLEIDQSHLFQHWAEPGVDDEEKKAFFDQVCSFCNFFSFLLRWICAHAILILSFLVGSNFILMCCCLGIQSIFVLNGLRNSE